MERKREIVIQKREHGQVLLPWLAARYTYHSAEKWKQYIDDQRIKINDCRTDPETVLNTGDKVAYFPEPVVEPPVNGDYKVIYENADLLVINKPSDLPCHPGGVYFENTLWHILKQRYDYFSLINRLDRETSGIMLIAKNKVSASFYFNKMMEREIDKEYLVLVHGILKDDIDARGWLVNDSDSIIRKKRKFISDSDAVQEGGEGNPEREFSHTTFSTIKTDSRYSLLRCRILTGRTHQIRATICSLGYPVVGDKIYGLSDSLFFKFINRTLTTEEGNSLVIGNQALHSYKTSLPMLNEEMKTFTCPPPPAWPISI